MSPVFAVTGGVRGKMVRELETGEKKKNESLENFTFGFKWIGPISANNACTYLCTAPRCENRSKIIISRCFARERQVSSDFSGIARRLKRLLCVLYVTSLSTTSSYVMWKTQLHIPNIHCNALIKRIHERTTT